VRSCLTILLLVSVLVACGEAPPAVQRDKALNNAVRAMGDGDYDRALRQIDAAIKLDPAGSHLHQVRGSVLFHLKRYPDAVASYDEAVRLNTRNAEAALGAALALRLMEREGEALDRLAVAEDLFAYRLANPPDPERFSEEYLESAAIHAKLHLAVIAGLRGEKAAALGQIDRIKAAHPDWEQADAWRLIVERDAFDLLVGGAL